MSNKENALLVPKRRFTEFRSSQPWTPISLGKASTPVTERVGERNLTPVSISAGIGFVPQAEKFGRDISGSQYRLYTLVHDGDFVYNKGNSLRFPEGCVYLLQGWGQVAAPNVFICFRLKEGFSNGFFQNCFEANAHGKQLKKHITSGARSNGLLNISKEAFFGVEIPTPSLAEQQKIADCLASLDELIAAQVRKVKAMKAHKKGLIQRLFPREGETQPILRFPEFQRSGEWRLDKLQSLCVASVTYGIVQPGPHVPNGMPYIQSSDLSSELRAARLSRTSEIIAAKYRRSEVKPGDIVFSLRGDIGASQIVPDDIPVANLARGAARIRPKGSSRFCLYALQCPFVSDKISAATRGSTFQEISLASLREIPIPRPELAEQLRIADYLSGLDRLTMAAIQQLEALKTHKKGLMQQLFPLAEALEA